MGSGDCHRLVWEPRLVNPQLDEEQRRALAALLSNTNRVSIFRGGAGTGIMSRTGICRIRHGLAVGTVFDVFLMRQCPLCDNGITGKSFVRRELVEQLEHSGRRVVVLAPQRQQVAEMEKS